MWRRTLRQGSGWSDFQGVLIEGSACSVEGGLEGQGSERWESAVGAGRGHGGLHWRGLRTHLDLCHWEPGEAARPLAHSPKRVWYAEVEGARGTDRVRFGFVGWQACGTYQLRG